MKRLFCILLALCLLGGFALAEDAGDWKLFESSFGFTLWYSPGQLSFWEDDFDGEKAECFCPWEDQSGVAVLICLGSNFSPERWAGQTPVSLDEPVVGPEYPYEMTACTDGEVITEQWTVSVADGSYAFIVQYEAGDYQGWAPLFHDVLSTLEFPPQPVITDDFLLDFFQGGAAGMQFIDVVYDEDAEPITLVPYRDMEAFSLEYVEWDDDTFTVSRATPLYVADPLSPGDNLNIFCWFADVMPNLRIRYTDAEGNARCFLIFQSGRDGSLLLLPEDGL